MYPKETRERAIALLSSGQSMNSVSRQTGVSRAAIREWRDRGIEPVRPLSCFRCQSPPPDAETYALLFGFYLGDGCISRQRSTFSLRITCDKAYPHIIDTVSDALETVRVTGSVCRVRAPGCVVVQSCWKHWPCLFPQHGPGRKHERELVMQPWQREIVNEHPADFLRGLFHSDGCRTRNWATRVVAGEKKRYDYGRWQFVNNSEHIRTWCTEALDLLEIPWRQSSWKCVSVSTRDGVARLDELIGLKS
ncbi:MAG: transcriptional regulator [Nocardioidaceae bacterium]